MTSRPLRTAMDRRDARRPGIAARRLLVAAFVLVAGALAPQPLAAQPAAWTTTPAAQSNGNVQQMPVNRPVSRRNQLSLSIDPRWANSYGYRSILVSVSAPQPSKADRLITIRLQVGANSVEKSFLLPAGSTTAATTLAVPQFQTDWQFQTIRQHLWWDVWVDGVKDNDLSRPRTDGVFGGWSASSSGLTFLVAGPANSRRSLVAPSTNTQQFEVLSLPLAEFPRRWIEYTCLDVVSLSRDELTTLAQTNPAAFEALQRWLRAGGQLWVSDAGAEFDNLAELSKLLNLRNSIGRPPAAAADEQSDDDAADASQHGWRPVAYRDGFPEGQAVTFLEVDTGNLQTVSDPIEIVRMQNDSRYTIAAQQIEQLDADAQRRRAGNTDTSRWFVEQRSGLGTVRAFRGTNEIALFPQRQAPADPNAPEAPMPAALAMALGVSRGWDVRHGLAPDMPNLEFVRFLVPGVGLAPVLEFEILITLFVLIIGPLNYWLLRRWGRLHLLVLTVPLAAVMMTAALFAYALVADGFGTKVRAQSFTTLDQRTGEAASWTRLSYYSGLAPAQGLAMPDDVALYPIIPSWSAGNIDAVATQPRDIVWQPGQARLTRGWLRSRTPTQYLAVRSRKSPHRLELLSGGERLRATNGLGTQIELVVVVDGDGNFWSGEAIDDGEVVFLEPIERSEAARLVRKRISDNEPQAPPALLDSDSHFAVMQRRMRRQAWGSQYSGSEPQLSYNLANNAVRELAETSDRPALDLPPRSYVAFTTTGQEVEFGIRAAKEEASFHITLGQW